MSVDTIITGIVEKLKDHKQAFEEFIEINEGRKEADKPQKIYDLYKQYPELYCLASILTIDNKTTKISDISEKIEKHSEQIKSKQNEIKENEEWIKRYAAKKNKPRKNKKKSFRELKTEKVKNSAKLDSELTELKKEKQELKVTKDFEIKNLENDVNNFLASQDNLNNSIFEYYMELVKTFDLNYEKTEFEPALIPKNISSRIYAILKENFEKETPKKTRVRMIRNELPEPIKVKEYAEPSPEDKKLEHKMFKRLLLVGGAISLGLVASIYSLLPNRSSYNKPKSSKQISAETYNKLEGIVADVLKEAEKLNSKASKEEIKRVNEKVEKMFKEYPLFKWSRLGEGEIYEASSEDTINTPHGKVKIIDYDSKSQILYLKHIQTNSKIIYQLTGITTRSFDDSPDHFINLSDEKNFDYPIDIDTTLSQVRLLKKGGQGYIFEGEVNEKLTEQMNSISGIKVSYHMGGKVHDVKKGGFFRNYFKEKPEGFQLMIKLPNGHTLSRNYIIGPKKE